MGQVCVHCGHQGESTDPYCRSCGELNDGSTIVLGAPERRGETSTRRAAPITIALIILGLAGFAWLTQSPVQETSVGPTVVTNPPRRISVPSTTVGSNPVLDGFFSASTIDASDASLIVLTSAGLSHIVLATGTVSPVLVDEPARGEEISVIDGDLVYLSSTGAWVVPLNGGLAEFLGPANRVLPSRQPDRVWIGVHLEPEPHSQPLLWTEVDQAGDVHRDQIRTLPFPFVYPGLTWGEGGVYRLLDYPENSWRLMARGFPVAIGANDLVMTDCLGPGGCSRVWYDLSSGEERDPLLGDLADNFEPSYYGDISPDGRYVLSRSHRTPGIWHMVSGDRFDSECATPVISSWDASGSLVACAVPGGIVVYDVEAGEWVRFALDDSEVLDIQFVTAP